MAWSFSSFLWIECFLNNLNKTITSYRPFPFFVDSKIITSGPDVRINNNAPSWNTTSKFIFFWFYVILLGNKQKVFIDFTHKSLQSMQQSWFSSAAIDCIANPPTIFISWADCYQALACITTKWIQLCCNAVSLNCFFWSWYTNYKYVLGKPLSLAETYWCLPYEG